MRYAGQGDLHEGDQDGPQNRPEKMADAADVGHHQHVAGRNGPDRFSGDDFVIDGEQAAGNSREKGRQRKLQRPDAAHVIADESGSFRIVAHGIGHPAQGRFGQQVHQAPH